MELVLHRVLYAPAISCTLILVAALDEEGYYMQIGVGHLKLTSLQGKCIGHISWTQGCLYKVVHMSESTNTMESMLLMELHQHLGHIAPSSAHKLVQSHSILGIELDTDSQETDCDVCIYTHATRLPVPTVQISPPAQHFGDEIHTDVWGPSTIATHQGHRYFATFTDNMMWYTIMYPLCTKDEALEAYKSSEAWAITQGHYTMVKVLRSDHGGKYLNGTFDQHLKKAGTVRKLTMHNTPQLNGVREHLNRTLLKRIHALTHASGLPKSLWGKALRHAAWLKNRTVMRALDSKTPFEALYSQPPNLSTLQIWGSQVHLLDKHQKRRCRAKCLFQDISAT